MKWSWCGAGIISLLLCASLASAAHAFSLQPLETEDARVLPSGVAEASLGVSYLDNQRFPPFTPPGTFSSQTLVKVPQFGFRVGAGGWAEIQASYETIYLNEHGSAGGSNWQLGSGDMRMFTKVWLARERRIMPALGLRFGTKLPNANRHNLLGTDDTDFLADALFTKHFGPVSGDINMGLLLLGNSGPSVGNSFPAGGQDDLFDYRVAVVSRSFGLDQPGAVQLRLLGELTGWAGSHYFNDRSALRAGIQMTRGSGTVFLGVSVGLITASENVGASTGFIYRFNLAKLLEEGNGAQ